MPATIRARDLTDDQRLRFGIPIEQASSRPHKNQFTPRECRQWALRVMGMLSRLNQRERERVLMQAIRVNQV